MSDTGDSSKPKTVPAQHQSVQPGLEHEMNPRPEYIRDGYKGSGRLEGMVAVVTGGDSGIGRAVAVHFAREGADVAIAYLNEDRDAEETRGLVEAEGRRCLLFRGDLGYEETCRDLIARVVETFGPRIHVLVNNAAEQHPKGSLDEITAEQLERTFRTNIFAQFFLTKAALPHLQKDSSIICTTSVTAYRGNPQLVDYSSTKGAIVTFVRSMAAQLAEKGIRVNGVAPGPIWTPLIPSTFPAEKVEKFGGSEPLGRVGQPSDVAPCYVFLASADAAYMSGQILHPNGGEPVES
ncbi:SDR family oxidoreductase [Indioceanicola profundi]|uniref:SDR family oxidoreductase n=1 Tax=Indioceanicola profundi TaxID=2220096 RepID=UPI000E6ADD24|nr:SDR family oxidoreductase [Indioceanicola profundi]